MSDFKSDYWSLYVAGLTFVSILACLLLLWITARKKIVSHGDNTTGHVWDEDLREMNNPMPRWWMWLFVLTVVFAFGYLAVYPGLGSMPGSFGWTSVGQHATEQAKARAETAPLFAAFAATPVPQLARNPQAMAVGERLFANNCATCHGSDAHGSKGFPNLTDTDWLWGGTPERIKETITMGRQGMMPPFAAAVGTAEDVRNVANYVLSLSGSAHNEIAAQAGRPKFAVCAACHGADGKGNQALGAPNLTDKIWLHGWGEDAIVAMVTNGKTNVMPAHGQRLSAEQIHVLAAYVMSLSRSSATAAK